MVVPASVPSVDKIVLLQNYQNSIKLWSYERYGCMQTDACIKIEITTWNNIIISIW